MYQRINHRVDEMIGLGAVDEVRGLLDLNLSFTAEKIIGIKELGSFIRGETSLKDAAELMKKNTRHYAKRQLTWFRKDQRIQWLDAEKVTVDGIIESSVD